MLEKNLLKISIRNRRNVKLVVGVTMVIIRIWKLSGFIVMQPIIFQQTALLTEKIRGRLWPVSQNLPKIRIQRGKPRR